MNKSTFTIWCNNEFGPGDTRELELLKRVASDHRLMLFERDDLGEAARAALRTADIVFGYPAPEAVIESEKVRWVQLDSAGYTSYDHDEIKRELTTRKIALTNSSAVFDEPCAQHLLAMITSLARQLPQSLDSQRGDRTWEMEVRRSSSRLLNGQTLLMLGFGAIARRLVELLTPLKMNLVAVRRHVSGNEPLQVMHISKVDELLPSADHVVNILPANEQSRHFLNSSRFERFKHGALVYNIGRGSTIDQDALLNALNSGRLAAAYLDVTEPEPLPPDHPLWTTPNCFITPHSGGGHSDEKERQVKHFLKNLGRFERNEELINRVL